MRSGTSGQRSTWSGADESGEGEKRPGGEVGEGPGGTEGGPEQASDEAGGEVPEALDAGEEEGRDEDAQLAVSWVKAM